MTASFELVECLQAIELARAAGFTIKEDGMEGSIIESPSEEINDFPIYWKVLKVSEAFDVATQHLLEDERPADVKALTSEMMDYVQECMPARCERVLWLIGTETEITAKLKDLCVMEGNTIIAQIRYATLEQFQEHLTTYFPKKEVLDSVKITLTVANNYSTKRLPSAAASQYKTPAFQTSHQELEAFVASFKEQPGWWSQLEAVTEGLLRGRKSVGLSDEQGLHLIMEHNFTGTYQVPLWVASKSEFLIVHLAAHLVYWSNTLKPGDVVHIPYLIGSFDTIHALRTCEMLRFFVINTGISLEMQEGDSSKRNLLNRFVGNALKYQCTFIDN